ncbi:MAG: ATP-binding protein [Planctomycetota bacterium]|jgi:signal transduction histidine kinase
MATLVIIRGPGAGTKITLREGVQRMGRDSQCEIHFDDSETSRNHAEIQCGDGNAVIKDLGSSNGTFVNGEKVEARELKAGDFIQIGKRLLVYQPSHGETLVEDSDIDILPPSDDDASQIIGRADLEEPIGGTVVWKGESPAIESSSRSMWEIMYRTSVAVSRTLDIDQLLRQILDLIFQWVECDNGCIMLADPETGQLRPSARRSRRPKAKHRLAISKTILDYVVKNDEGVLTSDAHADQRWDSSASIERGGIREAICVPMRGRYGMVGIIYIDTSTAYGNRIRNPQTPIFNEQHLKMLISIGHQAALAIEDTTYYQSMLQAERLAAVGQTIATLSHHIKNILQGLRGGKYMVAEGIKRENLEAIGSGWKICEKTHDRIESLVLDMLSISKDRKPERRPTDLREVISDAVDVCRARADENHVALVWDKPASFPRMMLDSEAMHRAVLNLIGNALDACGEKADGQVAVTLEENTDGAVLRVIDNGVGIPESDLQKIFSLFESSKGSRGTGLGLPVSLKIAKEHGGKLTVQSAVGAGTTFTLELPWRANAQVADASQPVEK